MNNIKFLRKQNNKTQAEIAEILKVAPTTYGGYENGINEPTIDTLCKLADYHNVSLDYLVGREFGNGLGYMSEDQINFVKTFLCLNQTNQMKTIIYAANLLAKQN